LFGAEVAAVDENQAAVVKSDRPPAGRAHQLLFPDPNAMAGHHTEIIDHDAAAFSVCAGVHPHPHTHRHRIRGNVVMVQPFGHICRLTAISTGCLKNEQVGLRRDAGESRSRGGVVGGLQ
jgi:hypothetical protein